MNDLVKQNRRLVSILILKLLCLLDPFKQIENLFINMQTIVDCFSFQKVLCTLANLLHKFRLSVLGLQNVGLLAFELPV
jgi:hypothetical protein